MKKAKETDTCENFCKDGTYEPTYICLETFIAGCNRIVGSEISMTDYKRISNEMEKETAQDSSGVKQINSGAFIFHKGDVKTNLTLRDCKGTEQKRKSVSIREEDMKKIAKEAFESGKEIGILVFTFGERIGNRLVKYVALRETDFDCLESELVALRDNNVAIVPSGGDKFVDALPPDKDKDNVCDVNRGATIDGSALDTFLSGQTTTFINKRRRSLDVDD